MTRRQQAVMSALADEPNFRSAQEIYAAMRAGGERIGLTTVYRTLTALAEAGELDVLRTTSGEAMYRRCATERHHHHLVCRSCGRTVEVAGTPVERWAAKVSSEHGFTEVDHTVEMFGRCAECSR